MSQVTAILVAYNSAGVIVGALRSLSSPEIASIIVVDNGSADDTCELIRRDFPKVTLIENASNEGFGRANNLALKKVKTPYALLLNPDARLEEGALAQLLAASARYPDAAILAPALYDEQGRFHRSFKRSVFVREGSTLSLRERVVSAANRVRVFSIMPSPRLTPPPLPRGEGVQGDLCAEFLSGAVWLLNMNLMREVGFFDPNIFLYYEDDDLCLRVRRAGHGLVLAPAARAVHLMGASSGATQPEAEFFKQRQLAWSRLYLERKYHGQAAVNRLAIKLHFEYSLKAAWYSLKLDKAKINRYKGRLEGLAEFSERATSARAA